MNPSTEGHLYLNELWQAYESQVKDILSPKSIEHYHREYKNFCLWANIKNIIHTSQVTSDVVESFIRYAYTVRRSAPFEISTLRRMWNYVLRGHPNPWEVKIPNLIRINTPVPVNHRPFTIRECRQIFKTIDPQFGDALRFSYWYGMRIGSVCSLKWKDFVGWKRKNSFIHLPPKTARSRPIYLELPILPEIRDSIINAQSRDKVWLFPDLHAIYLRSPTSICKEFKKIVQDCHIKDNLFGIATLHSFRSTFITKMDEVGAPVYITDSITGHASRDMHGLYSKPSVHSKKKWILKALPPTIL